VELSDFMFTAVRYNKQKTPSIFTGVNVKVSYKIQCPATSIHADSNTVRLEYEGQKPRL